MKTILNVHSAVPPTLYYENAMITGIIYHCKKCDYVGPVVLERDMTEEEMRHGKEEKRQ